ncbi:tektin-2-like [Tachypleus tridentatus]|uniref:tektin-2-like n=1 Tax=Tachypleus tridentatus TaxID=6853 RepID=UPI003FCFF4D2
MFYEKQVDHHSPAEWTANNDSIALATKQVISSSHNLRTQSHYQRNESKNRILWKNQETNLALSERVLDIKLWHKTLEETLKTIEEEISALLETKTALESALMNKVPLLEATKMCLMLKDRRTNVDVVEDDQYHQVKKLEREIARGKNEVQELEKSLQDTAGPMKVVQTRLENRKWRPQMELCGDTPQTSLHQEFMHLRDVQSALQQKLQEARSSLNRLQYQLHQVASDIELKESTLEIENQCSKTHSYPRLDPYLTQLSWISKDKPFLQTVMDDTPVSDAYILPIAETENQVEKHQFEPLSEKITSKNHNWYND